ncbi:MAG: hypothetical protein L7S67_09350 [Flavobacteriales bacterium]|nr:hypothetical protein [Flavobacteriales bacterium]
MIRHHLPLVLLAAAVMTSPAFAQPNLNRPNAPEPSLACLEDCEQHDCEASRQARRKLDAEARLLEANARRAQAATNALNAQRALIREEQHRVRASRQAIVSEAKQREWEQRRAEVKLDQLTGHLGDYNAVVLTSVTGVNPKHSVAQVAEVLSGLDALNFVNPLKIKRKYRTHRNLAPDYVYRPGVLRASLHRETLNEYGRFVHLILRDHKGTVVYDARFENVHFAEMLAPLSGAAAY